MLVVHHFTHHQTKSFKPLWDSPPASNYHTDLAYIFASQYERNTPQEARNIVTQPLPVKWNLTVFPADSKDTIECDRQYIHTNKSNISFLLISKI
jgi:hypothetical protein